MILKAKNSTNIQCRRTVIKADAINTIRQSTVVAVLKQQHTRLMFFKGFSVPTYESFFLLALTPTLALHMRYSQLLVPQNISSRNMFYAKYLFKLLN